MNLLGKTVAIGFAGALMLGYACFGGESTASFKTAEHEVTISFPSPPAKILKGENGGQTLTSKSSFGGRTTIYAFSDLGPNFAGKDEIIREYLFHRKDEFGEGVRSKKQTLVEDPQNGVFCYLVTYKDRYDRKIIVYYDFIEKESRIFAAAQMTILPPLKSEEGIARDSSFFNSLKIEETAGPPSEAVKLLNGSGS